MTKAIIFISGRLNPEAADRSLDHIKNCGYEFAGIERNWDEAKRMMRAGIVDVVVVDDEDHLDPQRKPRIEVVANQPASRYETRTRLIRRDGAR